jgi:hypothetical protein
VRNNSTHLRNDVGAEADTPYASTSARQPPARSAEWQVHREERVRGLASFKREQQKITRWGIAQLFAGVSVTGYRLQLAARRRESTAHRVAV